MYRFSIIVSQPLGERIADEVEQGEQCAEWRAPVIDSVSCVFKRIWAK
jgi:hypothetical protein